MFRYNESYDIYLRLENEYDTVWSMWNSGNYGIYTFSIWDTSNPYSWGKVIDSVQINTPNYYNIGEDGFYFKSIRPLT